MSKGENVSEERVAQLKNKVWEAIAYDNYTEAFSLASELWELSADSANHILGVMYTNGWGVSADYKTALKYFKKSVQVHDEDEASSWYMGGMLLLFQKDYANAIKWLVNAEKMGEKDAKPMIAQCYYSTALDMRAFACRVSDAGKYSQANAAAIKTAIAAQDIYMDVAESEELDMLSWVAVGRMAQMLYNIACRGEFDMQTTSIGLRGSYFKSSLDIFGGACDIKSPETWRQNVVNVCAAMDEHGMSTVGEYFRAIYSMTDSELNKSASAFYRAKWHLRRAEQLSRSIDPKAKDDLREVLSDIDESCRKLENEYGQAVISMMRSGELPNITLSYPAGKAPEVEGCDDFMNMLKAVKSSGAGTSEGTSSEKLKGIKKKLFGFFGR